jgi:hypothetical protein
VFVDAAILRPDTTRWRYCKEQLLVAIIAVKCIQHHMKAAITFMAPLRCKVTFTSNPEQELAEYV